MVLVKRSDPSPPQETDWAHPELMYLDAEGAWRTASCAREAIEKNCMVHDGGIRDASGDTNVGDDLVKMVEGSGSRFERRCWAQTRKPEPCISHPKVSSRSV